MYVFSLADDQLQAPTYALLSPKLSFRASRSGEESGVTRFLHHQTPRCTRGDKRCI